VQGKQEYVNKDNRRSQLQVPCPLQIDSCDSKGKLNCSRKRNKTGNAGGHSKGLYPVSRITIQQGKVTSSFILLCWVKRQCGVADGYQCFTGTYCLHLQGRNEPS
jgi:hypothetical protein